MLVLSRHVGESIGIGSNIVVHVNRIQGNRVVLGITAPPEVPLKRTELPDRTSPVDCGPAEVKPKKLKAA